MINEIQLGPVTIHIYGLMMGIGFISAYLLTDYRGKKKGYNTDIIFGILWWVACWGPVFYIIL